MYATLLLLSSTMGGDVTPAQAVVPAGCTGMPAPGPCCDSGRLMRGRASSPVCTRIMPQSRPVMIAASRSSPCPSRGRPGRALLRFVQLRLPAGKPARQDSCTGPPSSPQVGLLCCRSVRRSYAAAVCLS